MFPHLIKQIARAASLRHRNGKTKLLALIAALFIVGSLVPMPKDFRNTLADVGTIPSPSLNTQDIIVDSSADDTSANCEVYVLFSDPDSNGGCTLRAAIELARNTGGYNRIVFDTSVHEIELDSPIIITPDVVGDYVEIIGTITNEDIPAVHIFPSSAFSGGQFGPQGSACTNSPAFNSELDPAINVPPLISINSADYTSIQNLMLTNTNSSAGNLIEMIDTSFASIRHNWIGTDTRDPDNYQELTGAQFHGICVTAQTGTITSNYISGNIIAGSLEDGIRMEGGYDGSSRNSASGSTISNNLIGTLTGFDARGGAGSYQGNAFSGITLKMTDDINITSNIIINNGLDLLNTPFPGDGITLLEANTTRIVGNLIGATSLTESNTTIDTEFPLPLNGGTLDLPTNIAIEDYSDRYNMCDGISIRFYDPVTLTDAPLICPDADAFLSNTEDDITNTPASSQLIGPSVSNSVYNNTIGYNRRNGIYVQSMACNLSSTIGQTGQRHNLPNILARDAETPLIAQSIHNSFFQNTLYNNDGNSGSTTTGADSYGIGIDLEDFATAALDLPDESSFGGSYWDTIAPTSLDCTAGSDVQPVQPVSDEMDYNITENDNYTNNDENGGYDPDAGANRLVNAPVINQFASTPSNIQGTAPEGTLVELYQVACNTDDYSSITGSEARTNCDADYWNENDSDNTDVTDEHQFGHGQGSRFLGNAYVVPDEDDETTIGAWSIEPASFSGAAEIYNVQTFSGGVVTATATAVETLCWDDQEEPQCDTAVSPAMTEIAAQRAAAEDSTDYLWIPANFPSQCSYIEITETTFTPGIDIDCLGSTSEFSANALIADAPAAAFEVVKTLQNDTSNLSPGTVASYQIAVTNTGVETLDITAGALSDVLDTNLSLVSCSWLKLSSSFVDEGTGTCTPSSTARELLDSTDFGSLNSGSSLYIVVNATINLPSIGQECTISNTVDVDPAAIFILNTSTTATEIGSTPEDHAAEDITITNCGQIPGLSVQKTVSIAEAPETTVNTSASSTAPVAGVSGAITYYIDIANTGSATATGVVLTDAFPSQLGLTGWSCASTTASGAILNSHSSGITYTPDNCSVNTSSGVISTATSIGPQSVVRIRLTGQDVPTATNNTAICNSVTATASGGLTATDSACFQVGLPSLSLTKTANDTTPTAGSTVTYTLTVSNTGGFSANDVVISDDLDDTTIGNTLIPQCVTTIASITPLDSGVINSSANSIAWTVGSIPAGESRVVRFRGVIRSDMTTATSCANLARVTSSNATTTTGNVTIAVGIPVASAVLSINKEAVNESDIYELGDAVHYRVTISNSGNAASTGLSVQDSIPSAEEDLRLATSTSGTVSTTGGELNVSGMSVAADGSAVVNYTVSIAEDDDFPLRSYRLDQDADADDEQFYPERVRDDDVADSDHDDAEDALGARDDEYVSLGSGGEIVLDIASRRSGLTKLLVDGDGDDFCIAEQDLAGDTDRDTERYTVSVSQTTRSRDFERVGRSNGGSDCFDIGDADLTWARYIQIEDTSGSVSGDAPGVDVDAVCLLNLGGMVTNTAGLYQSEELLGTSEETILVNFTDAFEDPAEESDCRTNAVTIAADPLPNPPVELPPAPPVYVAPPVFQLPKTGPVAAGAPVLGGTGILSAMWWMLKRRRS